MAILGPEAFETHQLELPLALRAIRLLSEKLIGQKSDAIDLLKTDGIMRESGDAQCIKHILWNIHQGTITTQNHLDDLQIDGATRDISPHVLMGALKAVCRSLNINEALLKLDDLATLQDILEQDFGAEALSTAFYACVERILLKYKDVPLEKIGDRALNVYAIMKAMQTLFILGQKVARREEYNRMSKDNVAIIIGPILNEILPLVRRLDPLEYAEKQGILNDAAKKLLDFEYDIDLELDFDKSSIAGDEPTTTIDRTFDSLAEVRQKQSEQAERERLLREIASKPPQSTRRRTLSLRGIKGLRSVSRQQPKTSANGLVNDWKAEAAEIAQRATEALAGELDTSKAHGNVLGKSIGAGKPFWDEMRARAKSKSAPVKPKHSLNNETGVLSDSSTLSTSSDSDESHDLFDDVAYEKRRENRP